MKGSTYTVFKELYNGRSREQRSVFNLNSPISGQSLYQFGHTVPMGPQKKEFFEISTEPNTEVTTLLEPSVWGPKFWYTLHMSSHNYPEKASPIIVERMKGFIKAIPFILPCEKCKIHALQYIESHTDNLDMICSGQKELFDFFFNFHNAVNKRLNKPQMDYTVARKLYLGKI